MARGRILFVDDEPNVLEALRRALRGKRDVWEMDFVCSGEEALRAHERNPFDVVVTDMSMPGMNGFELAQALARLMHRPVPIMLTGTADLQTAVDAINETNIFRFYTKPCSAEILAGGIGDALDLHGSREKGPEPQARPTAAFGLGAAALDLLPVGVIVVDFQLRVVFMNRHGGEMVARADGITIAANGECRASTVAETAELHRLIADAMRDDAEESEEGAMSLPSRSTGRPLAVTVSPLAPGVLSGDFRDRGAMILLNDPERHPLPSAAVIGRLFELTEGEARLARSLAEGKRLEEAAGDAGITISSARTYLKRIFSKTGTGRQAELVRLILTSVIALDQGD